jgi:hypothetical protein
MQKLLFVFFILGLGISATYAQFDPMKGSVTGNFKLDAQTNIPDTTIGADTVREKLLSNSYMNIIYNYGKFTAGVRFEGYLNTMLGYDKPYDGFGIGYRFATYNGELFEITAGNFYEQFGNGLVLRTYEDRDLGYDNSVDGARVKFKPVKGVTITGVIGHQRVYWEVGQGIVRGVDGDFNLNEFIPAMAESNSRISLGGSFVSKYQPDENPFFILPENVGAGAGRINYSFKNFNINTEYAHKGQDPSADNKYIYKHGNALLVNSSYSRHGLGIMFQYKWVDNMSFRSERNAQLNNLSINYLPAISKNHSYAFAAMYPYSTQVNGEAGFQGELFYKFKRNSIIGGKYGTMLNVNFSTIYDIKKTPLDDNTPIGQTGTDGYEAKFLSMSDSLFSTDFNITIQKKYTKKLKGNISYQHIKYNIMALQGHGQTHDGMVDANVAVVDMTYRIKPKHSIRVEAEALFTKKVDFVTPAGETIQIKQDYGNWAMLILEYSISPNWFFALSDQFNFVSSDDDIAKNTLKYVHEMDMKRNHFFQASMGYSKGSSRIQVSYGKQREGILCVGGVCRQVPAAYGFNVSITSTF